MQRISENKLAWFALGLGGVATIVAFVLSFRVLRTALPIGTASALSTFILICPLFLVAAFLIARRSRGGRFPVTLGHDLTDAWYYVLVMNVLVVGSWHRVTTLWNAPSWWDSKLDIFAFAVSFLLLLYRLNEIRGQWRLASRQE